MNAIILNKEIQTSNLNFLYRKHYSTQSQSPTQNNLILQCDLFFRPHKGGVGCEKTGFECRINAYNSRFKKGLVSQIEKSLLWVNEDTFVWTGEIYFRKIYTKIGRINSN